MLQQRLFRKLRIIFIIASLKKKEMKYLNLILFLIIVHAFQVNAQIDFASIGSKWYYDYSGFGFEGYLTLESVRDTLVSEKECKIIKHQSISFDYTNWPAQQIIDTVNLNNKILCFENNVVYHYFDSTFYKLIDFNAEVGDKWTLKIPDYFTDCDTTVITVDSVYQQLFNNLELKTLLVSQPEDANVGFASFSSIELLEKIGPLYYLFGIPISETSASCGVLQTSGLGVGNLRCYSDDVIGEIKFGETDCEFIVDSIYLNVKELLNAQIALPFYNEGFVYFNDFELNKKIIICDISGNIIYRGFIPNDKKISLRKYPSGMYIVKVLGGNREWKFFVD